MQTLTVVNSMLATMGEAPLASLEEPHAFKGAALAYLDRENRIIQARGWWFNIEELTLQPMLNGRISLANDIVAVRTSDPKIVQRGQYLYNLDGGTDIFTESKDVLAIRVVPFENLPEVMSDYIGWCAAHVFQLNYDGDSARTRELEQLKANAYVAVRADDIRNKRVNMILSNPRLAIMHSRRNRIPRNNG